MQTPRLLISDCPLENEDAPADGRAPDISSPRRERLEERLRKTLLLPFAAAKKLDKLAIRRALTRQLVRRSGIGRSPDPVAHFSLGRSIAADRQNPRGRSSRRRRLSSSPPGEFNMFEKIGNGWDLMKSSARVLREDTSLLLFPVVSGIACLIVVASFALPLFLTGAYRIDENTRQLTHNPIAYAVLLLFYFCNYFVIIFFNSALVSCAIIRFKGGTPTLSDGFQAAVSRLPQILAWSLVSAFVGVALKALESRSEKVGAFISGLLGLAWSIATFFVVPVIVIERAGPFEAVRRSMSILRRAWGEAFVGNQGIGFFAFIAAVVACAPAALGFAVGSGVAIAIGIAITAFLEIGLAIVSAALHTILLGALYVYAAEGRIPYAFDGTVLQAACARRN
jgi:Family of unknown function (DUF6159)